VANSSGGFPDALMQRVARQCVGTSVGPYSRGPVRLPRLWVLLRPVDARMPMVHTPAPPALMLERRSGFRMGVKYGSGHSQGFTRCGERPGVWYPGFAEVPHPAHECVGVAVVT